MDVVWQRKDPLEDIKKRNELKAELKTLTAQEQIQLLISAKGFSHGKSKKKKGKKK